MTALAVTRRPARPPRAEAVIPSTHRWSLGLQLTLPPAACALLLGTGGPLWAQDAAPPSADDLRRQLYSLESYATLGLAAQTGSNRLLGAYGPAVGGGIWGMAELDSVQRDAATGTWTRWRASQQGADRSQLRFTLERQGAWGFSAWGQQSVRREPVVVNTGLQGEGTAVQTVSASTPRTDIDLKVRRSTGGLSARVWLLPQLELQASTQEEDQQGSRLYGRGTPSVMEFLTEPIDRKHRQWNALLLWGQGPWRLNGGLSGSQYTNRAPVLTSAGGNTSSFTTAWLMALPPSNSAFQGHLAGSVRSSAQWHTHFKLQRTVAQQDQPFDARLTRLTGAPENLDGRVVTTLVFIDSTWRPAREWDLHLQWRSEDRDDQTPANRFLAEQLPTVGGSFGIAGVSGLVKPRSWRSDKAVAEAAWRPAEGWKLGAGAEQETQRRRVTDKYRRVGMRERTDEDTARLDLRHAGDGPMAGTLSLLHSRRGGSDYLPDTYDPAALTNQVNALLWADRERDRVRLALDGQWGEQGSWALQGEQSHDRYSGRDMGPREGQTHYASLDLGWRFNDRWQLSAWLGADRIHSRQITRSDRVGTASSGYDVVWQADIAYDTRHSGLQLLGRLADDSQLGWNASTATSRARHQFDKLAGAGTLPAAGLPEIRYQQWRTSAWAEWTARRDTRLRLTVAHERQTHNDWTWAGWVYNGAPTVSASLRSSDGSTLTLLPQEQLTTVMLQLRHSWR